MVSAALKMAVVCMLLLSAGQLMLVSAGRDAGDATEALLRVQELEEEVAAEEFALLVDDDVGATVCPTNCQKCLVSCGTSLTCLKSITSPTKYITCIVQCAIKKNCFSKK